jgi:hypothetical protein
MASYKEHGTTVVTLGYKYFEDIPVNMCHTFQGYEGD